MPPAFPQVTLPVVDSQLRLPQLSPQLQASTAVAPAPMTTHEPVASNPPPTPTPTLQSILLFVSQFPDICNEQQLAEFIRPSGIITTITIVRDLNGRSMGQAWVTLQTFQSVEDTIASLNTIRIPPLMNPIKVQYVQNVIPSPVTAPSTVDLLSPTSRTTHNPYPAHAPIPRFAPTPLLPQQTASTPTPLWGGYPTPSTPTNAGDTPPAAGTPTSTSSKQSRRSSTTRPAIARGSMQSQFPALSKRKLFIGQLPKTMGHDDVWNLMQEFGEVEDLHLLKDKRTGEPTGAAFCVYCKDDGAQKAILSLNGQRFLEGMRTPMQVRLSEGDQTSEGTKLFVGQVPYSATREDLVTLFEAFGPLNEVAMIMDRAGNSRGCAFVHYARKDDAQAAIEALHEVHKMNDSSTPLIVKIASTESQKQKLRKLRNQEP
eukprot:Sspe_Gene.45790::Locus_22745_Transcript_1_1_Confidence_1.000_Length_1541::g.45790::m.45790/K13207/CUGBP, BRUNOL, CELF; CUG-BP- and ETR3-like factor